RRRSSLTFSTASRNLFTSTGTASGRITVSETTTLARSAIYARPIAIPGDAAIPCITRLSLLSKTILYQLAKFLECHCFISPRHFQMDHRSFRCRQHHDAHDALAIDLDTFPEDLDIRI